MICVGVCVYQLIIYQNLGILTGKGGLFELLLSWQRKKRREIKSVFELYNFFHVEISTIRCFFIVLYFFVVQ